MKAFVVKGNLENGKIDIRLGRQMNQQHVLCSMDLGAIVFLKPDQRNRVFFHFIDNLSPGSRNKPGTWSCSRLQTLQKAQYDPGPLRYAQGVRILFGPSLPLPDNVAKEGECHKKA